jgi:DNA-binding transcriptional LysR family regulator
VNWLIPRLGEFMELYPEIRINLVVTDEELDLSMRQADVGIRMRQPSQPDVIQRKLFAVHFHAYASPGYLKRFGTPRTLDDLDQHRILLLDGGSVPSYLQKNRNWLVEVGRNGKGPRPSYFVVNNILGVMQGCQKDLGIALLPDYLVEDSGLVQLFGEGDEIALDCYFVYPEELKSVARVQVFRDFLVANAQRWNF